MIYRLHTHSGSSTDPLSVSLTASLQTVLLPPFKYSWTVNVKTNLHKKVEITFNKRRTLNSSCITIHLIGVKVVRIHDSHFAFYSSHTLKSTLPFKPSFKTHSTEDSVLNLHLFHIPPFWVISSTGLNIHSGLSNAFVTDAMFTSSPV